MTPVDRGDNIRRKEICLRLSEVWNYIISNTNDYCHYYYDCYYYQSGSYTTEKNVPKCTSEDDWLPPCRNYCVQVHFLV